MQQNKSNVKNFHNLILAIVKWGGKNFIIYYSVTKYNNK